MPQLGTAGATYPKSPLSSTEALRLLAAYKASPSLTRTTSLLSQRKIQNAPVWSYRPGEPPVTLSTRGQSSLVQMIH